MIDRKIEQFVTELSGRDPVPGGGSVAALAGAMGAALGTMAISLTRGKKKYAEVEGELASAQTQLLALRDEFLNLVEEDAAAFLPLSRVYGMPKGEARDEAMERALMNAAEPPLSVLRQCRKTADLIEEIERITSPLVISDVGCAAAMTIACAKAAALNVMINAKMLKDETASQRLFHETEELTKEVNSTLEGVYGKVEAELCRRY